MYNPEKFQIHDAARLLPLIAEFPFATVTTVSDGKPWISHLPVLATAGDGGEIILEGHMARKNPQWRHVAAGSEMLIAFTGPQAYINPVWYTDGDVPTWNYIAIHGRGRAALMETAADLQAMLRRLSAHMNRLGEPWEFYLPEDLQGPGRLEAAIVGFQMRTADLTGKFKLSQNRTRRDQEGVIAGLSRRRDDGSRGVREWMERLLKSDL